MPIITWNNQPLTLTAKVDALLNPTDTLLWAYEFIPALIPDPWGSTYELAWNGVESGCTSGTQYLSGGRWRFTALSGTVDETNHRIEITRQDNGELLATLIALDQPVDISIPDNIDLYLDLVQPGSPAIATVEFTRTHDWDTNGERPHITPAGPQLSVDWRYTPTKGTVTARANVYNGNNVLIATSNAITLTISGESSGGS